MATNGSASEDAGGVRSPRYPSMSLKAAVEKVRAIYDADKTAGSPVESALLYMGYKNAKSGPATKALAALKRYGLIDVRNSRAFPTHRAVAILRLPSDDPRRKDALREAALAPEIYRKYVEQYRKTGLPSASSFASELELHGEFNHNAVPGFVSDFFESLEFAGLADDKGVLLETVAVDGNDEEDDGDEGEFSDASRKRKVRKMVPGTKEDVFSLDEGPVVLSWPDRISKASAEDLQDWLELIGRKINRAANTPPPEDESPVDE